MKSPTQPWMSPSTLDGDAKNIQEKSDHRIVSGDGHNMVAPDSSSNNIFLPVMVFRPLFFYRLSCITVNPNLWLSEVLDYNSHYSSRLVRPELWIVQLFRSDFKPSLGSAQKHECSSLKQPPLSWDGESDEDCELQMWPTHFYIKKKILCGSTNLNRIFLSLSNP